MEKYPELTEKVLKLIGQGTPPAKVKAIISEATGFKKTKSNEIYNEILRKSLLDNDIFDFNLEVEGGEKPYFNAELNKYIVYISSLGRNIVVSEETHKRILELYSEWDGEGATLNEVCRAISWPRVVLTQYLKAFGITKDTLPITDRELEKFDDEELVARLNELRKFSLYQKFEKEDWSVTRTDAQKWRKFVHHQINPFKDIIENWKPNNLAADFTPNIVGDQTLLITCCDWHLGAFSDEDTTFRHLNLSTNKIARRILEYAERIVKDAEHLPIKEIVVFWGGDILHSAGSNGCTSKGTLLESDNKGGKLFKIALDVTALFLQKLLELKKPIRNISINGNHDSALNAGLLYALEALFKNDNITFSISNRFIESTIINNSIICYSHGAHPDLKTKLPKGGRIQNYAQSLFLAAQKTNPKCVSRYLFTCDLHHQHIQEYNDFMYVLLPSITGGDGYSDALNLNSRACQQTFLFDKEGVKTVTNYYFEK